MILIVGLGNFGMEYRGTLHNAGFDAIDRFATENGVEIKKAKCKSLIYEGHILGEKVVLAKPQTYMNLSGEAVVELKNQYTHQDDRCRGDVPDRPSQPSGRGS